MLGCPKTAPCGACRAPEHRLAWNHHARRQEGRAEASASVNVPAERTGPGSWALGAMLLLALCSIPATAPARGDLPHPPCGAASPFPAYPAEAAPGTAPAIVGAWQAGDGSPRWTPPACTGWAAAGAHGF